MRSASRLYLVALIAVLFLQLTGLSCLNDADAFGVTDAFWSSSAAGSVNADQDSDGCPCHSLFASGIGAPVDSQAPFQPAKTTTPIRYLALLSALIFHPPALA